jgi:hypothetical protein
VPYQLGEALVNSARTAGKEREQKSFVKTLFSF